MTRDLALALARRMGHTDLAAALTARERYHALLDRLEPAEAREVVLYVAEQMERDRERREALRFAVGFAAMVTMILAV